MNDSSPVCLDPQPRRELTWSFLSRLTRRGSSVRTWLVRWGLMLLLLLVEFVAFHSYATRQITWGYPQKIDQAVYLQRSYEAFEEMRASGFVVGLLRAMGLHGGAALPNGALMPAEACVMFRVFGAGRLAALGVNFIHFALLEIVLVATLRAVTGRWGPAAVGLGLLLCAGATFQETGGIFDFRMDFVTLCAFGVFACLVVRSNLFERRVWAVAACLAAAYTVLFRFLTVAYFLPLLGIVIVSTLISLRRPMNRESELRRLKNLCLGCLLAAAVTVPMFIHHLYRIDRYYMGLHAEGQQRFIRAKLFGNTTLLAHLTYYPRQIILHQTGLHYLTVAVIAILAARLIGKPVKADDAKARTCPRGMLAFVALCVLVPLIALTADVDKNATVGGIVLGPLTLLLALLAAGNRSLPPRMTQRAVAALAVAFGIGSQCYAYTRPSELTQHRAEVLRVLTLHDRIAVLCAERRLASPALASDSFADFLYVAAINVSAYERHGVLLDARELLATDLLAMPPEQILSACREADFVLTAPRQKGRAVMTPFEQSVDAAREQVDAYCQEHLHREDAFSAFGRDVLLFAR